MTSEVASPVATETTPLTTESTNLLNNSSGVSLLQLFVYIRTVLSTSAV